jgi:hypothetical protein
VSALTQVAAGIAGTLCYGRPTAGIAGTPS